MPGVRTNQAERRFVTFDVLCKVGTALSADWMRPSRSPRSIGRSRSNYKAGRPIETSKIGALERRNRGFRRMLRIVTDIRADPSHPRTFSVPNPKSRQYRMVLRWPAAWLSRASLPQVRFDVRVTFLPSPGQWRRPRRARFIYVGATLKQKGDHLSPPPAGGVAKGSRAILLVDRVDVSAIIEKQAGFLKIAGKSHVV